jgi:hypothetical protein
MPDVINNVAAILMWDIFLIGLFFFVSLGFGILMLFLPMETIAKGARGYFNRPGSLTNLQVGVATLIALVLIYYAGILANSLSDGWIDKADWLHPPILKILWVKTECNNKDNGPDWVKDTDDKLKVDVFHKIYSDRIPNCSPRYQVVSFYYHAKNSLWSDEVWRKYILYSQTMINISRALTLCFFLFLVFSLSRALRVVLRFQQLWPPIIRHKFRLGNWYKRELGISLAFVLFSLIGYYVAATVWQENEREIDSKVFGVHRTLENKLSKKLKLNPTYFEQMVQSPIFKPLRTFGVLEASGVAKKGDDLFVVNDKNNLIYVFSEQGKRKDTIDIKEDVFPRKKAKFEDIAYHSESDFFYIIGAHHKDNESYWKTIRFRLVKKNKQWQVKDLEILFLDKDILSNYPSKGRASVEGLAVLGNATTPVLLVGLRADSEACKEILKEKNESHLACAPILAFHSNGKDFRHIRLHRVRLDPAKTKDGYEFHLSGLTAVGNNHLFVLATSEDEKNKFHGNRVYSFLLQGERFSLNWASPEFAQNQKAEGVTVWPSGKGVQKKIAVVFDNDLEETGQLSYLVVADSVAALGK